MLLADDSSTLTVFAPTNDAFAALPPGVLANLLEPENQLPLTRVLSDHVLDYGAILSTDLSEGDQYVLSAITLPHTVNKDGATVTIDGATVVQADVLASNGVVHVIDAVLTAYLSVEGLLGPTLLDVVNATAELSTLKDAVLIASEYEAANESIAAALSAPGAYYQYTVLAPSNTAFGAIPSDTLTALLTPEYAEFLIGTLYNHVAMGRFLSSALRDGQTFSTLGSNYTVAINGSSGAVSIGGANVVTADVKAENGVAHVIDAVLVPDDLAFLLPIGGNGTTLVDLISSVETLSTLKSAVESADEGVALLLNSVGPWTAFAPVDAAFAVIPPTLLEPLLSGQPLPVPPGLLPDGFDVSLAGLLAYHVVPGKYASSDLMDGMALSTVVEVTSDQEGKLSVTIADGEVKINTATVIGADNEASNGVAHLIDALLFPPELQPILDALIPAPPTSSPTSSSPTSSPTLDEESMGSATVPAMLTSVVISVGFAALRPLA
jgi:uncharacterized surface protein with fasciclin (FAS1) repeats